MTGKLCSVCGGYDCSPCSDCGHISHVNGGWPFCPHPLLDGGMLGEFHERDLGPAFPPEDRYHTSLASLRRAERKHGLEPTSPNDTRQSANEWGRRELARQQARPENVRARQDAIRAALQRARG